MMYFTDKLAAALAKTSGKDIVHFAKEVEISSPTIDGKVYRTKHADDYMDRYGKYSETTVEIALCGGKAHGNGTGY
ncbi:hypothetical protein ANAPRD1_01030 [Anaplasma phagocytophilum]|uniref:hypothetical protein n=1 Tax=Anaplasma phagocytophilum TaxID=948 RepID=UPI0007DFF9FF|nr:hypothetical protein [Anaplasma phagocytophilum]SCV65846.1 hypothetical protein ANAPH2_01398 [Anaplasma phagocytophilum]SCV66286.1 hypothetical protein ANAPRD1_01030 [Anaplasma phagocytophilum]